MNGIIKKLEVLFNDINKYYSKYSFKLSINDIDNLLLNKNSVFDFFNQAFNKREFNVQVSEKYLTRILKDYDLTIDQIEEYVEKLRIEKEREEKARKRRNKKILIGTIISVLVISISLYGYNLYSERQEEIKEQLRLEKLSQEKQRDEKLRYVILDYLKQTDNRNIKQMLTYWADQPTRYWGINKNNEQGFISKSKIEESILKSFNLNSFSENEIKNISKTDEGEYNVSVLFKFTSKKTGIIKHIKSTTIFKFNQDNKIVQEFGNDNPIIIYDSSQKVKKRYSDGTYEGNLRNDKMVGYGKYVYDNGIIYEGEFKDGLVTGNGKLKWLNGDVYEGNFINLVREGYGEYRWASGEIYKGNWKGNRRDGVGEFITKNGEKFKQEWDLGKLIKKETPGDSTKDLVNAEYPIKSDSYSTSQPKQKKIDKAITDDEFINLKYHWSPGEPTGGQYYVFMNSSSGKWFDHHNTLNNDGYGLYQINKSLSNIYKSNISFADLDNYVFLGELNEITYFFDKKTSSANNYLKSKPLNGEGTPVILDSDEKINFIKSFSWPNKTFWIGLYLQNGDWVWISRTNK